MPAAPDARRKALAPLRSGIGWLLYFFMLAVVRLPHSWQIALGKRLGAAARHVMRARRRVVDRNLEVCFPELPAPERSALTAAHFAALGASLVEMAMGWFGPIDEIRRRVRVEGAQQLAAALAAGRGAILYSGHYTAFEFVFPVLAPLCPRLCGMYKTQRNDVVDKVMSIGRGRSFDRLFDKDSVRDMLRELERNSVVWYASDQSYSRKGSLLLPFFGEPAMTNTAISRIARISGAAVLPYFCRRLPGDEAYEIVIAAPLPGLPSGDAAEDTRRLVAVLEAFIRSCPEQYWWIHKRFKGRPPPHPDIYRRRRAARARGT